MKQLGYMGFARFGKCVRAALRHPNQTPDEETGDQGYVSSSVMCKLPWQILFENLLCPGR